MSERVQTGTPYSIRPGDDPLAYYTRVFARFLQLCFGVFDKGSYRWDPDDANSDIIINDQGTIKKEVVQKRPAITLSRGPMASGNIALDQLAGPLLVSKNAEGQKEYTPTLNQFTGSSRRTDLHSATMTYNCLSREGMEAQHIAWLAFKATRTLKRSLMKVGIHRVGEDVQIGSESSPGSIVQPDSNEIIMVSVSVPFYYQDTWTVEPFDKLLLNNIGLALRSEVGSPTEQDVVVSIKEPGIYGKKLCTENARSLNTKSWTGPLKAPKLRKR